MDSMDDTTIRINDGPKMTMGEFNTTTKLAGEDKRLIAIVNDLVAQGEALRQLKAEIKEAEKAAEESGYNRAALKRIVTRRLMTEDQLEDEAAVQRAVAELNDRLGRWANTPLGETTRDE